MTLLILGVALWSIAHLLPIWAPDLRRSISGKLGAGPSKGLAALVILGSVVLMVLGYQQAPVVNLWFPPAFLVHVNNLLMVVAVFIYIAGKMPSPVRRRIRHPQLIGTKTWAIAHLLVNGDLASVILFGGILVWAVVAVIGSNRRDGPRGELPEVEPRGWIAHIAVTVIVTSVIIWMHAFLFGVWPMPG